MSLNCYLTLQPRSSRRAMAVVGAGPSSGDGVMHRGITLPKHQCHVCQIIPLWESNCGKAIISSFVVWWVAFWSWSWISRTYFSPRQYIKRLFKRFLAGRLASLSDRINLKNPFHLPRQFMLADGHKAAVCREQFGDYKG